MESSDHLSPVEVVRVLVSRAITAAYNKTQIASPADISVQQELYVKITSPPAKAAAVGGNHKGLAVLLQTTDWRTVSRIPPKPAIMVRGSLFLQASLPLSLGTAPERNSSSLPTTATHVTTAAVVIMIRNRKASRFLKGCVTIQLQVGFNTTVAD